MQDTPPSAGLAPLFAFDPLPGTPIGKRLRLVSSTSEGERAVLFDSMPIHVFDATDKGAETVCVAMLSRAGLATNVEIAAAFGCHRNTVARLAGRLEREGMAAVVPAKRGPKGPHKVTPAVLAVIAEAGDGIAPARLVRLVACRTGVVLSVSHVRRLVRARAVQLSLSDAPTEGAVAVVPSATTPEPDRDDSGADDAGPGDFAFDPPATPPANVRGRYMGLALYYPAIAQLGLLDVARRVFGLPRSERFGVRAVMLSLFFMTLVRKPTPESAKHLRRAEFGAMVGSGRAPAVKTLRRKLDELAAQGRAAEFGTRLARHWAQTGLLATAYLYVDGHMKAYTGKRHLAEVWNSQRRMPLPGVHTYFVGAGDGRPLLFLTEPLSTNLAKAMPRVVAAIREVVGERPFTVVFDRGGYDGKLFAWLRSEKIGFITYQRGNPKLADDAFSRRETHFEGRRVRLKLAEDEVRVGGTGPWRRVVLRTKDGHQTPILTSLGPELGPARIACLCLARWRQENLFKYLGAHHGLDSLISYSAEPADPDQLVPNPQRKLLDRQIAERRRGATVLKAELGNALLDEPRSRSRSAHGLKIAQGGAVGRLRTLEADIASLVAARRLLPKHVSVAESGRPREVMRLEHKAIVDRIKISAYNAEEWLLDRLIAHYPNPHDVRDLLRSFAELSGQIRTTDHAVVVTLDPPDTPIHRRALHGLIADLNAAGATFPGTQLPVTYQVAVHHSEAAA